MLDTPMLPVTIQLTQCGQIISAMAHVQAGVQATGTTGQSGFADPVSGGASAQPSASPGATPGAAPVAGTADAATTSGVVTTQPPLPPPSKSQSASGGLDMIFWIIPIMLVVMIVMSTLAGRKDKKKKEEMVSAIKKHDKVQMLGGIIGTVAEIGDDDIVLRVEEGRIRFAKSAIAAVIGSARTSGTVETKPDGKSDARSDAKSGAKATA
jgi:preprotein translocase subunit YajC